jgi:predicted nucleotidyltransferase
MSLAISIDTDEIAAFCRRWHIAEFSLFGSVLRDDFGPESDIDALVRYAPEAAWSLWDHLDAQQELGALLGRKVDLVTVDGLKNPFRRREILSTREVIYAA